MATNAGDATTSAGDATTSAGDFFPAYLLMRTLQKVRKRQCQIEVSAEKDHHGSHCDHPGPQKPTENDSFAESTQTPVSDGRFMHYMGLIFGHERRRRDQDCKSQQEATTLQKVRKRQCSVAPARPTLFHKAAGRGGISPADCRLAPGGAWISPMRPQLPGSAKSQPFRSISLLAQSWPL